MRGNPYFLLLAWLLAACAMAPVQAGQTDSSSILQPLARQQEPLVGSYMHVLVTMEVAGSSQALKKGPEPVFRSQQEEILAGIEGEYIPAAVWRGAAGHMALYVTDSGLKKLSESGLVSAIKPVVGNLDIFDPDEELKKIEREIRKKGSALISVVPACVQGKESAGGAAGPDPCGDIEVRKRAFIGSLHPGHFKGFWMEGTMAMGQMWGKAYPQGNPSVDLDARIEGLYELKSRKDVLSLNLVNRDLKRLDADVHIPRVAWHTAALDSFPHGAGAVVRIGLRSYPGYAPRISMLTGTELREQEASVRRVFIEIMEDLEPGSTEALDLKPQMSGLLPVAEVRLKRESFLRMHAHPDPRIARVDWGTWVPFP